MLKISGRSLTRRHAARADVERWAWRLAPAGAVLLSLGLGLVLLGRRSFSADEGQAADLAGASVGQLAHLLRVGDAPHAAYTAVLEPWASLVGFDEWWLRLPSVAFAAAAVAMTFLLGLRLFDRWTALVASLALATSVFVVASSQRSRPTTLVLLTTTVAMFVFVIALERRTGWWWALDAVAILVAGTVSLYALAVVAAQLAAFLTFRPRPAFRGPAIALAAALVGLVPVAVVAHGPAAGQLAAGETPTLDTVAREVWRLVGANPLTIVLAIVGAIALIRGTLRGAEHWKVVLLGAWAAAPLVLALAVSVVEPAFVAANVVAAVPAVALLAAAGIVAQRQWIAVGLGAAMILSSGTRLVQWYTDSDPADWRAATRYVVRTQQPGEAVVALTTKERFAFQYYGPTGFLVDAASGPGVWLLIADHDADERLALGREVVGAPTYALLDERLFGVGVAVQHWALP